MDKKLIPGDVLIFKAEDKWLSKLIAWGTFSDVSHAAMVYDTEQMVEMGPEGIMVNKIDSGKGEAIYQLRLSPVQDTAPLIKAVDKYLDAEICYDMPALVLLGIVLIYRHINSDSRIYELINKLLTFACIAIDKLIAKLMGHPDAMTCSQLVYQVYLDCGGTYQLEIHGGVLQRNNACTIRLVDFAAQTESPLLGINADSILSDSIIEELCKDLLDALQEAEKKELSAIPPRYICDTTRNLLNRLENLSEIANIPMDALRVMPCDLAYHTDNLSLIEEFEIERIERLR